MFKHITSLPSKLSSWSWLDLCHCTDYLHYLILTLEGALTIKLKILQGTSKEPEKNWYVFIVIKGIKGRKKSIRVWKCRTWIFFVRKVKGKNCFYSRIWIILWTIEVEYISISSIYGACNILCVLDAHIIWCPLWK